VTRDTQHRPRKRDATANEPSASRVVVIVRIPRYCAERAIPSQKFALVLRRR
jgi:hypothetical protein